MRWWERAWVVALTALVALTGVGLIGGLRPFQRWSMFSTLGPTTSD
jgi:hypothetical protein